MTNVFITIILPIITCILGSTSITSIYFLVKYRKQNVELKNIEVARADFDSESVMLDNEAKKINIGDLYLEKMKEAADLIADVGRRSDDGLQEIKSEFKVLNDRLSGVEDKMNSFGNSLLKLSAQVMVLSDNVSIIEKFMNGPFMDYKNNLYKKS